MVNFLNELIQEKSPKEENQIDRAERKSKAASKIEPVDPTILNNLGNIEKMDQTKWHWDIMAPFLFRSNIFSSSQYYYLS